MAVWQERSKRKPSGGKYRPYRDKRKAALARQNVLTKIAGVEKRRLIRAAGNVRKLRCMTATHGNLYDPKTKKHKKVELIDVIENPASRHYARMDVLTKGAIVETDIGKARVTNRPGQEGYINLVLIERRAPEVKKKKKRKPVKKEPEKRSIISRLVGKKEKPKPVKKKVASEKPAAKKAPAKKPSKTAPKKTAPKKKPAPKKTTSKNATAKKSVKKKSK
jgi:small subunit ribosomal protein S8e